MFLNRIMCLLLARRQKNYSFNPPRSELLNQLSKSFCCKTLHHLKITTAKLVNAFYLRLLNTQGNSTQLPRRRHSPGAPIGPSPDYHPHTTFTGPVPQCLSNSQCLV